MGVFLQDKEKISAVYGGSVWTGFLSNLSQLMVVEKLYYGLNLFTVKGFLRREVAIFVELNLIYLRYIINLFLIIHFVYATYLVF